MSLKKTLFWGLWQLEFFIIGSGLFLLLFHTALFEEMTVFFYRGIALLVSACVAIALLFLFLIKIQRRVILTYKDLFLSIVLIFCLNLVFFTHLPVTADRSISVYLLDFLNNQPEISLTEEAITQRFVKEYVIGNDAIDKRLKEQVVSKNAREVEGKYQITEQGKFIVKFYNLITNLFLIEKQSTK